MSGYATIFSGVSCDTSCRVLENPGHLCDFGASLSTSGGPEVQAVLEELDIVNRLRLTLGIIRDYSIIPSWNPLFRVAEERVYPVQVAGQDPSRCRGQGQLYSIEPF